VSQSYKLRLSDGTVLVVDGAGLSTWLVDSKAMVQVGGSQWHPLKEFLAEQRVAVRRAARKRAASSPSRDPLARDLPLVPPPPRKDRASPRAGASPPRDPLERELPLIPPPPRKDAASSRTPTPPPPDPHAREVPLVPPPPCNDEPLAEPATVFADEPLELSVGKPPDVQVLADEPSGTSARTEPARVPDTPVGTRPGSEAAFVSLPPDEPAPPSPIGEPSAVQVLAEEPTGPPVGPTPSPTPAAYLPVIRLKPSDSAPPMRRTPPPWQDPPAVAAEEPASSPAPPWRDPDPVAASSPTPPWRDPDPVAASSPAPPWRDPDPVAASSPTPPWRDPDPVAPPAVRGRKTSAPLDPAPVIRLKPLDDEAPPVRPSPAPRRDAPLDEEEPARPARPHRSEEPHRAEIVVTSLLRRPFGEKVLRATDALGALLSRGLAPINRLERGLPLLSPGEPPTRRAPLSPPSAPLPRPASPGAPSSTRVREEPLDSNPGDRRRTATADDSLPAIPLKPLDDDEGPLPLDRVRAQASAWVGGVAAWVHNVTRREHSQPTARADAPVPASGGLLPPPSLEAPPRLEELPVLRFAETHEPEEAEDVYDGDDGHSGVRLFQTAWLWTKGLVLIGALAGGAILAALTWRTWFPRAAQLGQTTFTEIDRHARSREVAREQQRAVEEASGELPLLAPETIRLVMAGSPTGVLEVPDVFHVASDAADRGLSALAPGEAEDLKTLRRRVLDALSPEERESVLSYEHARASRAVFPFEDREVVPLVARGVRALPVESQERLRELLGKAIAAGLDAGTDAAPAATTAP
jgi:hypothetical protein